MSRALDSQLSILNGHFLPVGTDASRGSGADGIEQQAGLGPMHSFVFAPGQPEEQL